MRPGFRSLTVASFFLSMLISSWSQAGIVSRIRPTFTLMCNASYDSNILRYSHHDYNRVLNGDILTAAPVKTLDDVRTDLRFTSTIRYKLLKNLNGRVQASVNYAMYMVNPLNNFGWVSLTWKQQFAKRWNVLFNHFYEPYYYLRDYYDQDTNTRRHTDYAFSKSVAKLYFMPVDLVEFVIAGELGEFANNEYFTEYDGTRTEIRAEGIIRKDPWRIAVSYGLGVLDNTGFDALKQTYYELLDEDTESGEADYEENLYSVSVYYSLKLAGRESRIKFKSALTERYYTTERDPSIDPFHHGRRDIVNTTDLSLEQQLTKQVSFEIGATTINRDSRASAAIVSKVKDYSRAIGWVELSYDFK